MSFLFPSCFFNGRDLKIQKLLLDFLFLHWRIKLSRLNLWIESIECAVGLEFSLHFLLLMMLIVIVEEK